jgi:uncharacterized membrane protein (UPF0182 family)
VRFDWQDLFPQVPTPPARRVSGRPLAIAAALGAIIVAISVIADVVTELWWFDSLGLRRTYTLRLLAPAGTFVVALAIGAAWLGLNWDHAARKAARAPLWSGQVPSPLSGGRGRLMAALVALALAGLVAAGVATSWSKLALAATGGSFGVTEPIFGRDAGFYVFTLPALSIVRGALMILAVAALVGAVLIYGSGGTLSPRRQEFSVPHGARGHLGFLAAACLIAWAAGQWLLRYELLSAARSGRGFAGPGYVDVVLRLPGLAAVTIGALVAAALCLAAGRRRGLGLAVVAVAVVATLRLVLVDALPAVVQRYRVLPNELALESKYIGHNIELTLAAHGLDDVHTDEYDPAGRLTADMLARSASTFENVRLWDWRVARRTIQQQQEIRPQYEFVDVDVDRYEVPGSQTKRQMLLTARELMASQIQNPTWVNRHLAFTHGFGLVAAPVDEVSTSGSPVLWLRNIPPESRPPLDLDLTQPRIYFGEGDAAAYAVVGTSQPEFDFPTETGSAENSYDGADGVPVASLPRRLAYALRFRDVDLLVSGALLPGSRIQIHRNVRERLHEVAPFLRYDLDPYLVVTAEGRLVWMADAYTATDAYPYSAPVRSMAAASAPLVGDNYYRNSVKATVDAYDGTVKLYVVDPDDPIVRAWSVVYPDLMTPVTAMPAGLVAHWRYPEALFLAQTATYARYHMTDPATFYLAEDLWQVPVEMTQDGEWEPMEPYYVTVQLRGETEPEFVLILPFGPANKKNMVAWMAARSDPEHYGELIVYRFDRGRFVVGPEQVESRIDQEPAVSRELTLLGQEGSVTVRGNLLVIPVEDALVFVEPLYLQAERTESALPELKRVIVVSGERVVMRPTLTGALAAAVALVPESAAESGADVQIPIDELVRRLRDQWDRASSARREGDWTEFGREMTDFESALEELEEAAGVESLDAPVPGVAPSGDSTSGNGSAP